MARDYQINGECLVRVRGGAHLSGGIGFLTELGLTDRDGVVRIMPEWRHRDVKVDDFGPDVPAELQWQMAQAKIHMTLVHYDRDVLDQCVGEAMGGVADASLALGQQAGSLVPAGQPFGRYKPMFASGNHYIRVNLAANNGFPWRFLSCVLQGPPLEIPLGTRRSHVKLIWRAIPYTLPGLVSGGSLASGGILVDGIIFSSGKEISSSGVELWDHLDV